jgi:hypothetical protein
MLDWAGLIARKYDLLQQDADTRRMGMVADAGLTNVKAGLLPKQAEADIRLSGAQAGLAGANAGLADANARNVEETTKYVGPLASANIFNTRAQGRLYGEQATGEGQLNRVLPSLFRLRGLGDSLGTLLDNSARAYNPRLGM